MNTTGAAAFDIDAYLARSGALDLSGIDWARVPRHRLPPEAIRTLKYMQDIESHTIVYLRSLLATRAIDDPDVARFLACWVYEESFHGLALERFLAAAGHPVGPRPTPHGAESPAQWLEARVTALLSRVWPDFCAVHMTWGAINELTTLTGYRRLAALAGHPVLSELLERITRDESRHFFFYYRQAELRLRRPAVARVARCWSTASGRPWGAASSRRASFASWRAISSPIRGGVPPPARPTRQSVSYRASRRYDCWRTGWIVSPRED